MSVPTRIPGRFRKGVALAAAAATLSAALAALPPAASTAPLPVTRLAYSAKFICSDAGTSEFLGIPAKAAAATIIEIHNPHTVAVTCTIKVVQDLPPIGPPILGPFPVTLEPNGTYELDCTDLPVPPPFSVRFGFVEVTTPLQLKVVAVYSAAVALRGTTKSVALAKKRAWPFFFNPLVRHSATCLCGDTQTPEDIIRHETTVSLQNVSNSTVNAAVRIYTQAGLVNTFNRILTPGGFGAVTCADVPGNGPVVAGVVVEYNNGGLGLSFLECEEIIQKHVISGANGLGTMQVLEVQPVPLR